MLQFKSVVIYRWVYFMDTHARLTLNVVPIFISDGFLRIIDADVIIRHILDHRPDAPMMKIIELGLAEIEEVDDFRDFRTRVRWV